MKVYFIRFIRLDSAARRSKTAAESRKTVLRKSLSGFRIS